MKTVIWSISLLYFLSTLSCIDQPNQDSTRKENSIIGDESKNNEETNDYLNIDIESHAGKMFFLKYWDQMTEQEFRYVSRKLVETEEIKLLEVANLFKVYFTIFNENDSIRFNVKPQFNDNGHLTEILLEVDGRRGNDLEYELEERKFKKITEVYKSKYGRPKFEKADLGPFGFDQQYIWTHENRMVTIAELYRLINNPIYKSDEPRLFIYRITYFGESVLKKDSHNKENLKRKTEKTYENI